MTYHKQDENFAGKLLDLIEQQGNLSVQYPPPEIAGEHWYFDAQPAISSCSVYVFVVSQIALESPYLTFEWGFAIGEGKPIVIAQLEPAELPPYFSELPTFEFMDGADPFYELIAELRKESLTGIMSTFVTMATSSPRLLAHILDSPVPRPESARPSSPFDEPEFELDDPDPANRIKAIIGLSKSADALTLPALLPGLKDSDDRVRAVSAIVLGVVGDAGGVPALMEGLDDSVRAVRLNAIWALGEIHAELALPSLLAHLNDEDETTRLLIIRAIGNYKGHNDPVEMLSVSLTDENHLVIEATASALRKIGTEDALKAVKTWEKETDGS